jgi:HSP20 family protein
MAAIVKCTQWPFFRDIQNEVNGLLDQNLFPEEKGTVGVRVTQWSPRVDIKEELDKYIIQADLPGIDPKEIDISIEENVLTIRGERKLMHHVKEENYSRIERFSGKFSRQFTLPELAKTDGIQARGKNGVLDIIIPKKDPVVPKKIAVAVEVE